ncbi:MAG: carotenoid biosynthesis protein [Cyclobacteriaceae bacterium]|nr:carotenoid biosynthesis protein [Cyclobacteriaceae bacterium]
MKIVLSGYQMHLLFMKNANFTYSFVVLIVFHFAGFCGLLSPYSSLFMLLTPFNLMLSAVLLWRHHVSEVKPLIYFFGFTFTLGFFVEYLGANFGFLFGSYSYGDTLGIKLLNVPIVIGLNWMMIIYSIATVLDRTSISIWAKVTVGSALAVFMDWLIEPIAIRYDFWSWEQGAIPLQNYFGWLITSAVMLAAYYLFKVESKNRLALPLYIVQASFFAFLQLGNFILRG